MPPSENGEELMVVASQEQTLDEYTSTVCLTRSLGEVLKQRECAGNARTYFVANLIFSAIFEKDMGLIDTIAKRIDGTVPVSSKRDSFANLIGDAIDDVLDMDRAEQTMVNADDPVIIALAKVVFHIATQPTRGDYTMKREKQKAVEMVYERTNGRRVEPVRPQIETIYTDPEWLTKGEEADEQSEDHDH